MSADSKKIKRLTGKIKILEAMIEDRSRQAYYEATRRSAINALLELSLKADIIDNYLSHILDLLFSATPLGIENKGAILLFDKHFEELELRSHCNLSQDHLNAIRQLSFNHLFSEQVLSKKSIFHLSESNNQFIQHLPEMKPHGHYFIPIRTGKKNYGVIILFTAVNTPRNNEDISFLTSIADICAGTIERINYSEQILNYQRDLEQQVEEQTRRLSEEKERLAVTLRSIGDGVIATDLDGRIVFVNKITEQITGWIQQEAVGKPVQKIFNIINDKNGLPCENPVDNVLASGMIVNPANHTLLIARDGTQYKVEESGAPIFDKESKMIGAVLVFRDVTVERKTAAELLKIKKLESVGVLAGGIAHDFKNILTAILGNIELAGLSIDTTSEAYPLLQEAKKASLRASALALQLLTFSKGGDPVKKTTSISNVITESAHFVLHGSKVACRFSIPDDLWLAHIDPGQIGQVIQNLAINAKHAMHEGGEIRISCANIADTESDPSLATLPDKKYIKITVQDSGCGIAKRHLEKIFDPYFTTKQDGSGLGLAICHSIVSKHTGHITVTSAIGEGTTFTIYLPAFDKQTSRSPGKKTQKPLARKAKILIMDDERLVRGTTKEMLIFLGHQVLLAADGKEAIQIFSVHHQTGEPIDVIIMDLTIPSGMGERRPCWKY